MPLDPEGHYKILKVSPEAGADEVRLAYAMAKQNASGPYLQKLEAAYEALKDPKRREAYDGEGVPEGTPILKNPITLVVAIAILIGAIAFLWVPDIRMRSRKFEAGQTLVKMGTSRPFGKVIQVDRSHQFNAGPAMTGYLVELAENGRRVWLPAIDLQATCETR